MKRIAKVLWPYWAITALLVAASAAMADEKYYYTNSAIDVKPVTLLPAEVVVKVSTNVVSGDNSSGCNLCYDNAGIHKGATPAVMGYVPCKPYVPATERWTTTTVVETTTLTIQWRGKEIVHNEEKVLSSVTKRWKLTNEWKQE